jgi:hypothetical protein
MMDGGKAHCGDPASWMPRVGLGGSLNWAIKKSLQRGCMICDRLLKKATNAEHSKKKDSSKS